VIDHFIWVKPKGYLFIFFKKKNLHREQPVAIDQMKRRKIEEAAAARL